MFLRYIYSCIPIILAFFITYVYINNSSTIICENRVELTTFSILKKLLSFFISSKIVYYGIMNNTPVVVKIFPNDTVCKKENDLCVIDYKEYITLEEATIKSMIMCPDSISIKDLVSSKTLQSINFAYVTETAMLEALPASDGWPVPKLLSSCRNIIIEKYMGHTITSATMTLTTRLKIAAGLLKLAEAFTFKHSRFRFYFTDISPDNVVVGPEMEVILVDLDHVIVVDTYNINNSPFWSILHVSETWANPDEFVFSTQSICQHSLSDHNYFAVCQHLLKRNNILGHGLLSEILVDVDHKYPELRLLVDECAEPSKDRNRIETGSQLLSLIQHILLSYE